MDDDVGTRSKLAISLAELSVRSLPRLSNESLRRENGVLTHPTSSNVRTILNEAMYACAGFARPQCFL